MKYIKKILFNKIILKIMKIFSEIYLKIFECEEHITYNSYDLFYQNISIHN